MTVILAILVGACGNPETTSVNVSTWPEGTAGSDRLQPGPGWFALGQFGCASCHAADGNGRPGAGRKGGWPGSADHRPGRHPARGYDAGAETRDPGRNICRGERSAYYVPRWQLDAAEMRALIVHIEQRFKDALPDSADLTNIRRRAGMRGRMRGTRTRGVRVAPENYRHSIRIAMR